MTTLHIDMTSDFICPWCLIGEQRLRAAAERIDGLALELCWKPFELNPAMPAEGMDRRAYRSRKFGSWERSLAMDAHVTDAGLTQGVAFDFARVARTPNTRRAHRLAWFAARHGVQAAVVPALFRAYFEQGRDIGDPEVLVQLAGEAGLDPDEVRSLLRGDAGTADVVRQEQEAVAAGVHAVPHFEVGARSFSGALGEDELALLLREAAAAEGGGR